MRKTQLLSICVFSLFLFELALTVSSGTNRTVLASETASSQDDRLVRGESGTSNGVVTDVD